MVYSQTPKLSLPILSFRSIVRRIEVDFRRIRIKYINQEAPRRIPAIIQIEATSKCNLRCPECSHSRENSVGQNLTENELKRILDRLPFPVEHVIMSGTGEPLLNPHFFLMIDVLAERQIECRFYTNGTLLTPQICKEILQRRNIVYLAISCDGAEKKTFENFRLGANFESWLQSVRHFLIKAKDERQDLRVGLNTVINKQNLNQLEEIIRLAAELGFNSIHFIDPVPVDDIAAANVPSKIEFSSINFEDLFELGSSFGLLVTWLIRGDTVSPMAIPRCLLPWEHLFIRANGDVLSCPAVFGTKKAAVMGNIFREDFANIWNGDRFREFRRTSITGTNSLCRVCPYH